VPTAGYRQRQRIQQTHRLKPNPLRGGSAKAEAVPKAGYRQRQRGGTLPHPAGGLGVGTPRSGFCPHQQQSQPTSIYHLPLRLQIVTLPIGGIPLAEGGIKTPLGTQGLKNRSEQI
jgi:hypothetical protein